MNLPLCIVLLYVVLLFAVSFYVSHKQRNNKESLLLYKGQNNTLIVAASVAGLAIGGASTIGISENAFAAGLSAGWYDTAWAIGAVIAGLFVVDRLRRGNYDTISDLIGDLYGSRTRILMVITMCLIQSGIIALQYKAGGSILAALLPKVFTVQSGTFFSFVIFIHFLRRQVKVLSAFFCLRYSIPCEIGFVPSFVPENCIPYMRRSFACTRD